MENSVFAGNSDADPLTGNTNLQERIRTFLNAATETPAQNPNPAAIPVEGYAKQRHAEKVELLKNEKFDLLMIGNSITHNFEKPEYQPIWNQFFAPRKAINLGQALTERKI